MNSIATAMVISFQVTRTNAPRFGRPAVYARQGGCQSRDGEEERWAMLLASIFLAKSSAGRFNLPPTEDLGEKGISERRPCAKRQELDLYGWSAWSAGCTAR